MNYLDVPSDKAVLQPGMPQFSPGAHSVRFVYSATFFRYFSFLRSKRTREEKIQKASH